MINPLPFPRMMSFIFSTDFWTSTSEYIISFVCSSSTSCSNAFLFQLTVEMLSMRSESEPFYQYRLANGMRGNRDLRHFLL
jgi:hypothetical protein